MSLFDFFKKKKKPEKKKPEEKPASAPAFAKATAGKKAKVDKKATALPSEALKERRREGGKKEVKKPAEEKKVVEDKEKPAQISEKLGRAKPKKGKETPQLYRILKSPHVSEKATDLAEKGKYVFKVFPEANKTEIKKAVKSLYGVDVLSVNIIKIPPKKRRLGKISGFKKGYKKAIIKIKKGQKIEIL